MHDRSGAFLPALHKKSPEISEGAAGPGPHALFLFGLTFIVWKTVVLGGEERSLHGSGLEPPQLTVKPHMRNLTQKV